MKLSLEQPAIPGIGTFPAKRDSGGGIAPSRLRDEPDWVLVERITGKKCPEHVSLRNLSRMTPTELSRTLGLSESEGKRLGAALVLGERLASEPIERGAPLDNVEKVARFFDGRVKDAKKESFWLITLNQRHQPIDLHRISEGSLSMTLVHPREAFSPAIRDSAAAVIFLHNHPSGDPEPSIDDLNLTRRLGESGDILGIRVLDHVVLGDGRFVSLADQGVLLGKNREGDRAAARENSPGSSEDRDREAETARESSRANEKSRDFVTGSPEHKISGVGKEPHGDTFVLGPTNKIHPNGPDYSGMVILGGKTHKADIWRERSGPDSPGSLVEISRKDGERLITIGRGNLSPHPGGEDLRTGDIRIGESEIRLVVKGLEKRPGALDHVRIMVLEERDRVRTVPRSRSSEKGRGIS
ncbi:MAG: DNA repair proteins (RadC) [Leptospirillum rubarum]|nr:MAG: DNA repair proteins (RadC) [Leptospirillum rubarum]